MQCSCGATFKKTKWNTNKKSVASYGYQCYSILRNGSKKFRENAGLPIEGCCNIRMIADWKLELMVHRIIEEIWTNRKKSAIEAFNIVRKFYSKNSKANKLLLQEIDRRILKQEEKSYKVTEMYLDETLTNEEFTSIKLEYNKTLEHLHKEKENLLEKIDKEKNAKLDVRKVKETLSEIIDFSQQSLERIIIDKFVDHVIPIDNSRFEWYINLTQNKKKVVRCSVSGRKGKASVDIMDEINEANSLGKKITPRGSAQACLLYTSRCV